MHYLFLYMSQRAISLRLGFLPYIKIPVLYILPANLTIRRTVMTKIMALTATCHHGTPTLNFTIIVIGDVKGKKEQNVASVLSGDSIMKMFTT